MAALNELADELQRGIGNFAAEFGRLLSAAGRGAGEALSAAGSAIGQGARVTYGAVTEFGVQSKRAVVGTSRISYHWLGQHTFPLEEANELPDKDEIPTIGWVLCTIPLPFTIVSVLASTTLVPLVGNIVQSIPKAFSTFANLGLIDFDENEKFGNTIGNDKRNFLRQIYGAPGLLLGGMVGLAVSGVILAGRTIYHTLLTSERTLMSVMNLALYPKRVDADGLGQNDDRHWSLKYVLGAPGLLLGGVLGGFVGTAIIAGRIIGESFTTGSRAFVSAANLMLSADDAMADEGLEQNDNRHWFQKYGLGAPGLLIGGVLMGGCAMAVIGMARIISNNFKTGIRAFSTVTNSTLADEDKLDIDGLEKNDNRHFMRKYIVGLPGLAVGAVCGGFAVLCIGIARTIAHNFKTGWRAFVSAVNFGAEGKVLGDGLEENDHRTWYQKYLLGAPGLAIGGLVLGSLALVTAAAAHTIINSFKTGFRGFISAANLALAAGDQIDADGLEKNDLRHWVRKYVFGAPGFAIGGVLLGGVAMCVIGVGRIISNNFKSGWRAYLTVSNLMREEAVPLAADERHWFQKYVIALPGMAIGGIVLGGIAVVAMGITQVLTHTLKSFWLGMVTTVNYALPADQKLEAVIDDRSWQKKYLVGGLGYFTGGIVVGGAACALIIVGSAVAKMGMLSGGLLLGGLGLMAKALVDFTRHNIDSGARSFVSMLNAFLPANKLIAANGLEQNDQRRWFVKYVLGAPGMIMGLATGLIAGIAVGAARIIANSVETGWRSFVSVTNAALHVDDQLPLLLNQQDGRSRLEKFVLGAPGFVLGGVLFGGLAFMTIGLGRIISNSFKSGYRTVVTMSNSVLDAEDKFVLAQDQRHWMPKYILGAPGIMIGAVLGSVSVVAISLGHIISNSFKTGVRAFISMANDVLHADDQILDDGIEQNDNRHWARKYVLGAPGLLVGGLVLGGLAVVAISIGRLITNNFKTGSRAFVTMANLALHPNDQIAEEGLEQNDHRHWIRKYLVGAPGLLIGGTLGALAVVAIGIGRLITNSFNTGYRAYVSIVNSVLPDDNQINEDGLGVNDNRHWFRQYVLGAPGFVVGGLVLGGLAVLTVGVARLITNSLNTGRRTIVSLMNFALDADNQIDEFDDNRRFFPRYGLGAPGLIVGGFIGSILALGIGVLRVIGQSVKSFQALAGSCVNAVVERPWFAGLEGDNRSPGQKAAGWLGYVLAAPLVPVSYFLYVTKKVFLLPVFFGFGLVCSPFVALKKCFEKPRFPERVMQGEHAIRDQNDVRQAFRDIYSSLTFYGKFNPAKPIVRNGDGEANLGYVIRKVLTFNMDTVTERTVNFMLDAYNKFDARNEGGIGREFFADRNIQRLKNEIKNYYRRTKSFLTTDQEQAELEHEIDSVVGFIKDYITAHFEQANQDYKPPANLYAPAGSWSVAFFGQAARQEQKVPEEKARHEGEPRLGFAGVQPGRRA